MKEIVAAINGLVKPLVALGLTATLIFLAIRGDVTATLFLPIVTFVLGYTFRRPVPPEK